MTRITVQVASSPHIEFRGASCVLVMRLLPPLPFQFSSSFVSHAHCLPQQLPSVSGAAAPPPSPYPFTTRPACQRQVEQVFTFASQSAECHQRLVKYTCIGRQRVCHRMSIQKLAVLPLHCILVPIGFCLLAFGMHPMSMSPVALVIVLYLCSLSLWKSPWYKKPSAHVALPLLYSDHLQTLLVYLPLP